MRRKTSKPTDRSRNSVGSEFQTIGPATEKPRWPNVIRRQRGTVSRCWLTELVDGQAIAYTRYSIYAVTRKNRIFSVEGHHTAPPTPRPIPITGGTPHGHSIAFIPLE